MGCWVQDPIQAAMLGLGDVAKYVTFNLTNKDPHMRFSAFWAHANDYMPDEDNGGNGMNGLQQMLVQSVDRHILLLPAWPHDWNASFSCTRRVSNDGGRNRAGWQDRRPDGYAAGKTKGCGNIG